MLLALIKELNMISYVNMNDLEQSSDDPLEVLKKYPHLMNLEQSYQENLIELKKLHKIHILMNDEYYIFYKHFMFDVDQAYENGTEPTSVEVLLENKHVLLKEIMEMCN